MTKEVWRRASIRAAAIVAFTIIAHSSALRAGFIWDDADHLTQNPCIIGPLGLKEIWTTTRAIYYPMVLTTFWAVHKIFGLNPVPYHLLNILFHSGSAVLLWQVLRQLEVRGSWLGAMLWALHPVTVQSVAWVTELKNTQSCFFYLLSILLFLKADLLAENQPAKSRALLALSLLSFIFAITSKTATVMLPAVLGLCLWWRKKNLKRRDLFLIAPFLFVSAAAAIWTVYEQRFLSLAVGPDWDLGLLSRLAIAGWNLWFYLGKILWPHPLIFIYPRWHVEALRWIDFAPALLAAVGLFLLWLKRNRNGALRSAFFSTSYFVVSLVPVLGLFNVYFFKFSFVSDHFQYLACMGPLALAGSGIFAAVGPLTRVNLWRPTIGAAVLVVLGALTFTQGLTYRDAETLYRATIKNDPKSWMAQFNLGEILLQRNEVDAGIDYLRKAANERPSDPKANSGLADALRGAGEVDESITYYRKALASTPDYLAAQIGLAIALEEKGELNEAISCYRAALRQEPNSSDIHFDLASVLLRDGQLVQAISECNKTLALKPDHSDAHVILGNVFLLQKEEQRALAEYESALKISPRSAIAQQNLAWILATASDHSLRNGARAVQYAEAASLFSGGNSASTLRTLAAARAENKDFALALVAARHALQLAREKGEASLVDALQQEIGLYEAGLTL